MVTTGTILREYNTSTTAKTVSTSPPAQNLLTEPPASTLQMNQTAQTSQNTGESQYPQKTHLISVTLNGSILKRSKKMIYKQCCYLKANPASPQSPLKKGRIPPNFPQKSPNPLTFPPAIAKISFSFIRQMR